MATGNIDCLTYLQSLAQTFANGAVPTTSPMDEDLIKLSVINHVQRLGLAEHFMLETELVLEQVYKYKLITNLSERGRALCVVCDSLVTTFLHSQVKSIKETMFSADIDPYSFVSPSAYDTAWLAIVP